MCHPRPVRWLLCCLTVLWSSSTFADDGPTLLARGQAAYRAVALREAAVLFREAADVAATNEAKAEALLWAGVAAGQAGEFAIAGRAFDDALRIVCGSSLPTAVSPKVSEVFRDAVARARCADRPGAPVPTTALPGPAGAIAVEGDDDGGTPPATLRSLPSPSPSPSPTPSPLGLVLTATGGLAFSGAVAVTIKAAFDVAAAADARTSQVEAQALIDQANVGIGVAAITAGVSAVVATMGVMVLVGASNAAIP